MARRIGLVLLAAVLPVVGACGGGTGSGGDTPVNGEPTTAAVKLWDPCTQIPADVLQGIDVDPAKKVSGAGGVHQAGWEICSWDGKQYTVSVLSGKHTMQDLETKDGNVDFQDVQVAGRSGKQFRVDGPSKKDSCDAVFPAAQGIVQILLDNSPLIDNPGDPCASLRTVGEQLVPLFPK